jgi:hypothetical protein
MEKVYRHHANIIIDFVKNEIVGKDVNSEISYVIIKHNLKFYYGNNKELKREIEYTLNSNNIRTYDIIGRSRGGWSKDEVLESVDVDMTEISLDNINQLGKNKKYKTKRKTSKNNSKMSLALIVSYIFFILTLLLLCGLLFDYYTEGKNQIVSYIIYNIKEQIVSYFLKLVFKISSFFRYLS